jgi:Bacterial TSP3 repeat
VWPCNNTVSNRGVFLSILEGDCQAPGTALLANYPAGDTVQFSFPSKLTALANGSRILLVTDAADGNLRSCVNLGNVVNGNETDRMVDADALQAFGIWVKEADVSGTLVAYAPLAMVADETGGGRVAFNAQMLYQMGNAGWNDPHRIRAVWLIQALGDMCRPAPAGTDVEVWCSNAANWTVNEPRVVHVYYDSWLLTGVDVREEHGARAAVIFEDPATDLDPNLDDNVLKIAQGLDSSFIAGRADFNFDDIKSRFDSQTSVIPDLDLRLWNIPRDKLRVQTYSFTRQDELLKLPTQHNKELLQTHFTNLNGTAKADAPVLLIAREEKLRTTNLDINALASVTGSRLVLSLDPVLRPEETFVGLQMAAYRKGNSGWEAYRLDQYLNQLNIKLKPVLQSIPDLYDANDADRDTTLNQAISITQSYYASLVLGLNRQVQSGQTRLASADAAPDLNIEQRASYGRGIGSGIKALLKKATEVFVNAITAPKAKSPIATTPPASTTLKSLVKKVFSFIGNKVKSGVETLKSLKRMLSSMSAAKKGVLFVVGVAVFALIAGTAGASIGLSPDKAATIGKVAVAAAMIAALAFTVYDMVSAANSAATGMKVAALAKLTTKGIKAAAVIGLIAEVLISTGIFLYTVISSGYSFASLEFNEAFATLVGQIAAAVILFAIGLIPVIGQLILALVGVIDALVAVICSAIPEDKKNQPGTEARKWLCGGISGFLAKYSSWMFYSNVVMVNVDDARRLKILDINATLLDPSKGYARGNSLNIAVDVQNSLELNVNHSPIPYSLLPFEGAQFQPGVFWYKSWMSAFYFWQFNGAILRSSSFDYRLASSQIDLHQNMQLNTMRNEWQQVRPNRPIWWSDPAGLLGLDPGPMTIKRTVSREYVLTQAGLNKSLPAVLSESYAVPVQECWTIPLFFVIPTLYIPTCYPRPKQASVHLPLGEGMTYDVFPETLDQFYQLTTRPGGYGLAWDAAFPRLKDADGDGLRNAADGGADPNDSLWDSDSDGLSDYFEREKNLNPLLADTDGDALGDREELIAGTDPFRIDTDNDGLNDNEELDGWDFPYAIQGATALITRVTSDPLKRDADGDGFDDFRERTYRFNPRV